MKWKNVSEEQLKHHLEKWIETLPANAIFLLDGPMGAGKTSFVNQLTQLRGVHSQSPTFALHQIHKKDLLTIHHWDLFRLKNDADLESVGFWDLISENGWHFIEWANRLGGDWWPPNVRVYQINIEIIDTSHRDYTIINYSN